VLRPGLVDVTLPAKRSCGEGPPRDLRVLDPTVAKFPGRRSDAARAPRTPDRGLVF